MAVPRNRTSNSRKNTRRSHMAKKPKMIKACLNCGKAHLPHAVCSGCGQYKGRQIFATAEK